MMSYLVVLIVDNMDQGPEVLHAWEQAGVLGVTILESTGLGRVRRAGLRDDLPLMPSLSDLFQNEEIHNRTLFSVVETQERVDKMVAAAQQVIGNLDDPHTGFLFVVPVLEVHGLGKHRTTRHLE
jgi:nitrogen regulatory protein PII